MKAVLDEVRGSLDLAPLNAFVHRWWISACDSARDPRGGGRCTAGPNRCWPEDDAPRASHGAKSSPLVEAT
ncbi:DUF6247 family protein [Microbispora sp. ZYX-F-249]|uniref:DUF6247 family protein n=1 Tax=Microbispora maris TaxID=3144104 RepID=A0ABV0B4J6_9ACTN